MIAIIYFLIILSVLVFVHELGHFLVAKYFDIRVDEFGIGYPPRAKKLFSWRGTDFTLNWLPFGGFVKIFGENPSEADNIEVEQVKNSFASKNRGIQASVLVSGVVFNFLFAWLLISIGFMSGMPAPLGMNLPITNPKTVITEVMPGSPAEIAGLKSGDVILGVNRENKISELDPEKLSNFIGSSKEPINISIKRGKEEFTKTINTSEAIVSDRVAIGVAMETMGSVYLGPSRAIIEGFKVTSDLTLLTAESLGVFIKQIFIGHADFSQVTGPVGLVGMVGNVEALGFIYILSFVALISINLSIVNLLPIPALDGGRLLIVCIEAIRRKNISPRIFNIANTVSFAFLLLLMLIITFRDVVKLV
ncbi:MAG: RIP metalloprotease RseP [Minisyncoccia bacterium]